MNLQHLKNIAQATIERTLESLPDDLREPLVNCRIETEDEYQMEAAGETKLDHNLLGVFTGNSLLDPVSEPCMEMPCIRLFLGNLWEHSGKNRTRFREEARVTLLHEIGHYFGMNEQQVADLGLA
jgi:predicted Zn-dependent protease with MMP-like domain